MKIILQLLSISIATLAPFSLQAAPPSNLLGKYLYFVEEGPEDYLIFDDATTGEKRVLVGGIDGFGYTFTPTGPTTATVVVTYPNGDYDEWNLTWDGAGTGTFTRDEYEDTALKDADMGRFVESGGSTAPPAGFSGIRLEETVEQNERFEFLTETEGREFEPGDVDPFTYVYDAVDASTATIVATFKPDRWDDLTLTFETETTGTYVLNRHDDNLLKDQKSGDFRLDLNQQVIDVVIGDDNGPLVGDDFFNQTGLNQTETVLLTGKGRVKIRSEIENDGADDSVKTRASRSSKKFETRYYTSKPRENVTAKISGSGLSLGDIGHDEREVINIEVRKKGKGRGRSIGWIEGRSSEVAGAEDKVRFRLIAK
jgi:hypothetical protein